jgi:hypothetical protein
VLRKNTQQAVMAPATDAASHQASIGFEQQIGDTIGIQADYVIKAAAICSARMVRMKT